MNHFDTDWAALIAALPRWLELDVAARRTLLDSLKPSASVEPRALGTQLDALQSAGLVQATARRATVADGMRPFVRALRGMDRHRDLFRKASVGRLRSYLEDHYSGDSLLAVTGGGRYGWIDRSEVARQVTSIGWAESFLRLDTAKQVAEWERSRTTGSEPPLLTSSATLRTLRQLVGELAAFPDGLRLSELSDLMAGASSATLGATVHASLRYLLCFAILDDELEPRLGLWPEVGRRMLQPPAPEPEPVEPEPGETFHAALMMLDMTAVLVAACGEPLRVRGADWDIYARQAKAIAGRLATMPEWLEDWTGIDAEARVTVAATMLRHFGFAETVGVPGRDLRIGPTRKGHAWLARSERDRLRELLLEARPDAARAKGGTRRIRALPLIVRSHPAGVFSGDADLEARLASAFLKLPEAFVAVDVFLRFHGERGNPLLPDPRRTVGRGAARFQPQWRREDLEQAWSTALADFVVARLLMLGGASVGRDADGEVCFRLEPPGRFLLGAADGFEYGCDADAQVVVQPNFEIVFLAPAPLAEARVAAMAERVGQGPGTMFRLTRASLLGAAEAGQSADAVVAALREVSSRELPANVETQIRDWLGSVRRVRVREAVLVHCPDEATAARVRAAAGAKARVLTPRVLELAGGSPQERKALTKKLRKEGVFVTAAGGTREGA